MAASRVSSISARIAKLSHAVQVVYATRRLCAFCLVYPYHLSQVAQSAPFVEKLVAKGYEVLYLTDAIDEATVTNLQKFQDMELVDVSKEGLAVSYVTHTHTHTHTQAVRCAVVLLLLTRQEGNKGAITAHLCAAPFLVLSAIVRICFPRICFPQHVLLALSSL